MSNWRHSDVKNELDYPNSDYEPGVIPISYTLARLGFTGLFGLTGGVHYGGGHNLPRYRRAFIVAPNHDVWHDPFSTGIAVYRELQRMVYAMAKQELWDNWLMGKVMDASRTFAMDRAKSLGEQAGALAYARDLISGGEILEICPQTTRKNHDPLTVPIKSLKAGSLNLAALYGLDVVPTGAVGKTSRYVYFHEPVNMGRYDFDITDRRERLQVGREVIEPFMAAELQPRMEEAIAIGLSRREELIYASMPRRFLKKVLE